LNREKEAELLAAVDAHRAATKAPSILDLVKRRPANEPPTWHDVPDNLTTATPPASVSKPRPTLDDGVVLTSGSDLTPSPVRWLWSGWLALGKLHILAGAPGQGKTTIALSFAATVTIGGRWPDGSRCPVGNVLIWSGEDDAADTLLPRLLAAGADRARVFFVSGTRVAGTVEPFDPARDLAALQAQAERIGEVRLIVVDPVVSAVTGDSHKNTEVRRALQPLVDMAANMGAALLGITHFSKGGQGQDPASRVVGSIAFTAVARVVLVAAKVKGDDGEDRRILARSKSNIGPDDGGFTYSLEQAEPLPDIHASYVAWGNTVEGSARELLTDPNQDDAGDDSAKTDGIDEVLIRFIGRDTVPGNTVKSHLKSEGFSEKQIRNARKRVGVTIKRTGFGKDTADYWVLPTGLELPNDAPSPALSSQSRPVMPSLQTWAEQAELGSTGQERQEDKPLSESTTPNDDEVM
jgi:putative DNA primase/helicase